MHRDVDAPCRHTSDRPVPVVRYPRRPIRSSEADRASYVRVLRLPPLAYLKKNRQGLVIMKKNKSGLVRPAAGYRWMISTGPIAVSMARYRGKAQFFFTHVRLILGEAAPPTGSPHGLEDSEHADHRCGVEHGT